MRILLPLLLLAGAVPVAQAAEAEAPWACYDVAVQGTLREIVSDDVNSDGWTSTRGLEIAVSKTYARRRTPDRILVSASSHAEPNPAAFKNALFFLSEGENGYGLISAWTDTPVDGRGLLSEGVVESLARKAGVERCKS